MPEPDQDIIRRFGANLKRRRERTGRTQEEVAIRAALHRTEIGLLERGQRSPRLETLIKVSVASGADFSELLHGIFWIPTTAEVPGTFEVIGPVLSPSAGVTARELRRRGHGLT